MKQIFLFISIAAIFAGTLSAQLKTKTHVGFMPRMEQTKLLPVKDLDLSPGKTLNFHHKSPATADTNDTVVDVYYNRPAGAFSANLYMGTYDYEIDDIYGRMIDNLLIGFTYEPYLYLKPYDDYRFTGEANGVSPDADYTWYLYYLDEGVGTKVYDGKDLTVDLGIEETKVPILEVTDDERQYVYQMGGRLEGEFHPSYMLSYPEPQRLYMEDDEPWVQGIYPLLSSKNLGISLMHGYDYYLMTMSGLKPYGNNKKGWWLGKNAGYGNVSIEGIAQAFEKPSHPYKLLRPVMMVSSLAVNEMVELTCNVYRLDEIPAYEPTSAVTLPEVPGELIATGVARVTCEQVNRCGDGNMFAFTLYQEQNGKMVEVTPTIDFPILVTIDGYNGPEMNNLVDFTASICTDTHVDEGFGELAYIKVGDTNNNYMWTGLNNFFSGGEMKTGLSIFLTAEYPFMRFNNKSDDGEHLFPDTGGWMEKALTDDNGEVITVDGIEITAWTPSKAGQWNVTCNGDPLPEWLEVELTDGQDENGDFNYNVKARVKALPLPVGMAYREAVVRFAFDGSFLDYNFMQGDRPAPDVTIQPEITTTMNDEAVFVRATGHGEIVLKIDGVTVDNPFPVIRGDEDMTVVATATAQQTGKQVSEVTTCEIFVPARIIPPTPAPDISYRMTDKAVIITAQGEGNVLLYIDGNLVDNPCTLNRGDEDRIVVATATAQGFGKQLSDMVVMDILIPAVEVPVPEVSDPPMINYSVNDEDVVIQAVGLGSIVLKIDGNGVDNPCTINRGDRDVKVLATATAQESGKLVSDIVTRQITIPAKVATPESPNALAMPNVTAQAGTTVVIPVLMFNNETITAFQTDIYLPEGFEISQNDSNYDIQPSGRIPSSHTMMFNRLEDGAVRVLCYSLGVESISGNDGELFYVTVNVPEAAPGEYTITLKGSRLTTMSLQELTVSDIYASIDVTGTVMGDANASGVVTVTDVMATAAFVMEENPYPFDTDAANVNLDEDISVADIALIARYVTNPSRKFPSRAPQRISTGDGMQVDDMTIMTGQTLPVDISLSNLFSYSSFQLDMTLPAGLKASNFRLSERAGDHTLTARHLADGRIRVLCYSLQNQQLAGSSGTLFSFDITALNSASGLVSLDDIEFVTSSCQQSMMDGVAFSVRNSSSVDDVKVPSALTLRAIGQSVVVETPVEQWITISDLLGHTRRHRVAAGRNVIQVGMTGVVIISADGHQPVKLLLR